MAISGKLTVSLYEAVRVLYCVTEGVEGFAKAHAEILAVRVVVCTPPDLVTCCLYVAIERYCTYKARFAQAG